MLVFVALLILLANGSDDYRLESIDKMTASVDKQMRLCGPLCCLRLFASYGIEVDRVKFIEGFTLSERGVPLGDLVQELERFFSDAECVAIGNRDLRVIPTPAIAIVNNGDHCVVLESVTIQSGIVTIWDPSDLRSKHIDCEEFSSIWTGEAIVLQRPFASRWQITSLLSIFCSIVGLYSMSHFSRIRSAKRLQE